MGNSCLCSTVCLEVSSTVCDDERPWDRHHVEQRGGTPRKHGVDSMADRSTSALSNDGRNSVMMLASTRNDVNPRSGAKTSACAFMQVSTDRSRSSAPDSNCAALSEVMERVLPIFLDIVEFLAASPNDVTNLCLLSSKSVARRCGDAMEDLWKKAFVNMWPVVHQWVEYCTSADKLCWRSLFAEMFAGQIECTLEVYHRQKRPGFIMSAMPAKVTWDSSDSTYVARYISTNNVPIERIPRTEGCRLRFCPLSARAALQPAKLPPVQPWNGARRQAFPYNHYPYKVLPGLEGLHPGEGVELQWKMQYDGPFGWWYGILESLVLMQDGQHASTALASIAFPQFSPTSKWYRAEVIIGDSKVRSCSFGGFNGGVRPTTQVERCIWYHFFPQPAVPTYGTIEC